MVLHGRMFNGSSVERCGRAVLGLALFLGFFGCKRETPVETTSTSAPTATTATPATTSAATGTAARKPKPIVFNVPVGPAFAVEPGVGIGPIRFGATVATIERLMDVPCPEKSETYCRYPIHAVEFELEDGVLSKIHIQGHERLAKNDGSGFVFGIFNGKLLNGVELGMYREYVESVMGPAPEGHEVGPGPTDRGFNLVYVAEYPGVRLEYDKLKNGNVVLAGIVLTKSDVPVATGTGKKAVPTPRAASPGGTAPRRMPLH